MSPSHDRMERESWHGPSSLALGVNASKQLVRVTGLLCAARFRRIDQYTLCAIRLGLLKEQWYKALPAGACRCRGWTATGMAQKPGGPTPAGRPDPAQGWLQGDGPAASGRFSILRQDPGGLHRGRQRAGGWCMPSIS